MLPVNNKGNPVCRPPGAHTYDPRMLIVGKFPWYTCRHSWVTIDVLKEGILRLMLSHFPSKITPFDCFFFCQEDAKEPTCLGLVIKLKETHELEICLNLKIALFLFITQMRRTWLE